MLDDLKDQIREGQLIEIKRNSDGKKYIYYRYVIEA